MRKLAAAGCMCVSIAAVCWLGLPAQAQSPAPADERAGSRIASLMRKGRHADAERQARSELAALEKAGQGDSLEAADILGQLAQAMWAGGKAADPQTREFAERAVSISERLLGPEHPGVARSLTDLGTLLNILGNHSAARPLVERAVAIQRKAAGRDDEEFARSLDAMGVILYRIGDAAGAKEFFTQSLAVNEKTFGPESLPVAQSLNDVAVACDHLKEYARARTLHERAIAIRRKALGADHFLLAASLNNLSIVLSHTGDLRGALALQEEALAIREKSLGPGHPNLGNGLNNIGFLRLRLGEFQPASDLLDRSLAIREKVYGPQHPEVAQSLENLAWALVGSGASVRALEAGLRSDAIARNYIRLNIRTLAEREAAAFVAQGGVGLGAAVAVLAGMPEPSEAVSRVWDAVTRSRAVTFDEMITRKQAVSDLYGSGSGPLAEALYSARRRYANLLRQSPRTPGGSEQGTALRQARQQMERAERALAESSIRFRKELAQAGAGFRDVAAALPPGSALVSFLEYRSSYPGEATSYTVFVLAGPAAAPVALSLGSTKEIDTLVSSWRDQIESEGRHAGRAKKRGEAASRRAGVALKKRIWDPVAARVGEVQRVFLVPDGAIHLVNIAALPVGADRYLVESGPMVHLLNTERDLLRDREKASGRGLLAMGDPDFGPSGNSRPTGARTATDACAPSGQLTFDRLPGAAREIHDLGAFWNRVDGPATVMTGARATVAAFRRAAPGKQVLHLATHGFYLAGRCGAASASPPEPWALAGVALAGANSDSGSGSSRGILTAEDAVGVDLEGVDWAVLSGCDTGLGKIDAHEGVFGLRRAFQLAGARTVITSLWPVEDEWGRRWMAKLYDARLRRKLGTAACVRAATLATLQSRRRAGLSTHPFYWAPYVAAGGWD